MSNSMSRTLVYSALIFKQQPLQHLDLDLGFESKWKQRQLKFNQDRLMMFRKNEVA